MVLSLAIKKWIHYDNPNCKKAYVKKGEAGLSTPKPNIHRAKVMLCIWWDQLGVIHYELLPSGQTFNAQLYRQQLIRLKQKIQAERPTYATRHESIIFHRYRGGKLLTQPHIAASVKNYLENNGW